jgi:hypothetical protein
MARYFFHMEDGCTIFDSEGVDLPNLEAARLEAIQAFGEMLRDIPNAVKQGDPFRLWVTNQPGGKGIKMFTLTVIAENG